MPVISVLLPVYNASKTLHRAIDSLLNQTFNDIEIIIVNNGSTDNSSAIIDTYDDPRIHHIVLNQRNLIQALNHGLGHCRGKYIARMDADDYSYPQRLELQFNYLEAHPDVSLVSGKVNYTGDTMINQGYVAYVQWANSISSHEEIYLSRFQESALPHPSVVFRKSLISEFGNYLYDVPEDFELWNRWLHHGVKMAKVNATILDWYDPPNRLSRKDENYSQTAFSNVKAKYFKLWFDERFEKPNQPPLYIFGYSKVIKQKTSDLIELGFEIRSFIDVKHTTSRFTIHFEELKNIKKKFVLSYVSDRTAKIEIKDYLMSIGMKEGENFLMMS